MALVSKFATPAVPAVIARRVYGFRLLNCPVGAYVKFNETQEKFDLSQGVNLYRANGQERWEKLELGCTAGVLVAEFAMSEDDKLDEPGGRPAFVDAAGAPASSVLAPGTAFVQNRRPEPTVVNRWDIAPTIYALALHKLVAGDFIVFRPDGTSVRFAAGSDVTAQVNWHTPAAPSLQWNLAARLMGSTAGSWQFNLAGKDPGAANAVGVGTPASFVSIMGGNSGLQNGDKPSFITSSLLTGTLDALLWLSCTADLVVGDPGAGLSEFSVVLIGVDRA